jgi:hypothetical protein
MDPTLHNITIVVIGTDRVVLVVVGLLGGDDALATNPDFHSENHGILVRKVRMEGFHFSIREPQRQVLPTIIAGRNSIASTLHIPSRRTYYPWAKLFSANRKVEMVRVGNNNLHPSDSKYIERGAATSPQQSQHVGGMIDIQLIKGTPLQHSNGNFPGKYQK